MPKHFIQQDNKSYVYASMFVHIVYPYMLFNYRNNNHVEQRKKKGDPYFYWRSLAMRKQNLTLYKQKYVYAEV